MDIVVLSKILLNLNGEETLNYVSSHPRIWYVYQNYKRLIWINKLKKDYPTKGINGNPKTHYLRIENNMCQEYGLYGYPSNCYLGNYNYYTFPNLNVKVYGNPLDKGTKLFGYKLTKSSLITCEIFYSAEDLFNCLKEKAKTISVLSDLFETFSDIEYREWFCYGYAGDEIGIFQTIF